MAEMTEQKKQNYRWVVWGILIVMFLIVHLQRLSLGVIREELTGDFGLSSLAFANLGSVYFYIYAVMQIPTGLLVDTVGVRITASAGMLLAGTGSLLFGFAPNTAVLFSGRFLVGLGLSVIFVSILKAQTQWFKESLFGTLAGVTGFVGNIGGLLAQTPLALLVALLTWRMSFAAIGVLALALALIGFIFIRNKPADIGLAPAALPMSMRTTGRNNETGRKNEKTSFVKGLKIVAGQPGTWLMFLVFAGFNGGFISLVSVWGTSYIVDVYGVAKVQATKYIFVMMIGAALGSIIIGRLSDYFGRRKLPMLVFGAVNVSCWVYLAVISSAQPPLALLTPFLFVLGFSNMGFILSHACGKEINPLELSGTATSVVNFGGFVGAAIVPLFLGVVFDNYLGTMPVNLVYAKAFLFCLVSSLAAFISALSSRETYCKNAYQGKRTGREIADVAE